MKLRNFHYSDLITTLFDKYISVFSTYITCVRYYKGRKLQNKLLVETFCSRVVILITVAHDAAVTWARRLPISLLRCIINASSEILITFSEWKVNACL